VTARLVGGGEFWGSSRVEPLGNRTPGFSLHLGVVHSVFPLRSVHPQGRFRTSRDRPWLVAPRLVPPCKTSLASSTGLPFLDSGPGFPTVPFFSEFTNSPLARHADRADFGVEILSALAGEPRADPAATSLGDSRQSPQ
jgi:hypothetical protein